jgi:LysM domain
MAEGQTQLARHPGRRPLLLAAVLLFGIAAAVAVVRWEGLVGPPAPRTPAPTAALATRPTPPFVPPPAAAPPAVAPAPPSFDVVRIDPSGRAVMAGRAPAGAEVTVTMAGPVGSKIVGTTESDPEGQWVLVPDQPLPAGAGTLALSARLPHGPSLASPDRVVVVVPNHPGGAPPVALLSGPAGVPRLIEPPPAARGASPVGLDLLQYGQGRQETLHLAGRAPPNANVRVYLDNHSVGDVAADPAGHWSLSVAQTVPPGPHEIRLDQISAAGTVVARIAVPFDRPAPSAAPAPMLAAGRAVVVRPGECLWVIAERAYGSGMRYTLIFQANRDQIRNPGLIYPGQVFTLPPAPAAAGKRG